MVDDEMAEAHAVSWQDATKKPDPAVGFHQGGLNAYAGPNGTHGRGAWPRKDRADGTVDCGRMAWFHGSMDDGMASSNKRAETGTAAENKEKILSIC